MPAAREVICSMGSTFHSVSTTVWNSSSVSVWLIMVWAAFSNASQ